MRGILNISINIDHFCRALTAASNGRLVNDLEAPAFSLSPLLRQLKDDILQFDSSISGVMMSVFFVNIISSLCKLKFVFVLGQVQGHRFSLCVIRRIPFHFQRKKSQNDTRD